MKSRHKPLIRDADKNNSVTLAKVQMVQYLVQHTIICEKVFYHFKVAANMLIFHLFPITIKHVLTGDMMVSAVLSPFN